PDDGRRARDRDERDARLHEGDRRREDRADPRLHHTRHRGRGDHVDAADRDDGQDPLHDDQGGGVRSPDARRVAEQSLHDARSAVERMDLKRVRTSCLEIAYEEGGSLDAFPVVLLHGFPYDPRAFDEVVPVLTAAGLRTIVPYLRGYGDTRFL